MDYMEPGFWKMFWKSFRKKFPIFEICIFHVFPQNPVLSRQIL